MQYTRCLVPCLLCDLLLLVHVICVGECGGGGGVHGAAALDFPERRVLTAVTVLSFRSLHKGAHPAHTHAPETALHSTMRVWQLSSSLEPPPHPLSPVTALFCPRCLPPPPPPAPLHGSCHTTRLSGAASFHRIPCGLQ